MRLVLLAVLALSSILLSMAAMHASMIEAHDSSSHLSAPATSMVMPAATAVQVVVGIGSDQGMGDMTMPDCLLLGMLCFLSATAVLLLVLVFARLRSILRPRIFAQSLEAVLGRLRPPEPPSLLVLSISRT